MNIPFLKPKPVAPTDIRNVVSVAGQAANNGWECDFFDFGKARRTDTDYFNCGIVERPDGLWLVPRRAVWDKRDKMGFNDIMAFWLDANLKPAVGKKVDLGQRWPIEHFEDPRAYYEGGKTFVSCCNFIRNRAGCQFPHQIICEVDSDWKLVKRYDPVYGHNGKDLNHNTKHEKNWVWFWNGNTLEQFPHMLYQPGIVVEMTPDFKVHKEWIDAVDLSVWNYGEIRGGTPPVLIGDEYLTFFHSATPYNAIKRQYHMGAYCFSASPPFRITRITIDPLLSGSASDGGVPDKPPCVFPNGAILRDGKWLVTFGVNDLRCAYVQIPYRDVLRRMIEV